MITSKRMGSIYIDMVTNTVGKRSRRRKQNSDGSGLLVTVIIVIAIVVFGSAFK